MKKSVWFKNIKSSSHKSFDFNNDYYYNSKSFISDKSCDFDNNSMGAN